MTIAPLAIRAAASRGGASMLAAARRGARAWRPPRACRGSRPTCKISDNAPRRHPAGRARRQQVDDRRPADQCRRGHRQPADRRHCGDAHQDARHHPGHRGRRYQHLLPRSAPATTSPCSTSRCPSRAPTSATRSRRRSPATSRARASTSSRCMLDGVDQPRRAVRHGAVAGRRRQGDRDRHPVRRRSPRTSPASSPSRATSRSSSRSPSPKSTATTVKQLGINLDGSITVGPVTCGSSTTPAIGGASGVDATATASSAKLGNAGPLTLDASLKALERRGALRTLAEPTLTAMSGPAGGVPRRRRVPRPDRRRRRQRHLHASRITA